MLRLLDIRPGEGRRAALAFTMLLLVVGAYTVVKSVRDALFLSKFGVTQLSFIAIGLAFVTSFIVQLYLKLTAGMPRNRLIGGTNIVIAASLAGIWLGLGNPSLAGILPWVLYIWSSIFGVFMVMQFWLLANDLFDAREAKRLFGFVGAGAILGGVSGGLLSTWLAPLLGTRALLLLAGGMLLGEMLLAQVVWPLRRVDELPRRGARKANQSGGFRTLFEHRYVGLLALALLLMTMTTTLLDWQFKAIVKVAYAGRTDEMAGFFGTLYAYLSAFSFVLQTFVTGWVLRRFGVKVSLLLLPLGLLAGSLTILGHALIPGLTRLWAASGAKIGEGGLRFAIDKATTELLWMPVPPHVKEQGKAFVDTVMDRLGTGLTGLAWLALAALGLASPARLHLISFAVIATAAVWLAVVLRTRRAYVDAFRGMLAQRLDLTDLRVGLLGAEARQTVDATLGSGDPRELEMALFLLSSWQGKLPNLEPLLRHPDEGVVVQTLELLAEQRDEQHREAALRCLRGGAARVRRAAIAYLRVSSRERDAEQVIAALEADEAVAATTVEIVKLGMPGYAAEAMAKLAKQLRRAEPRDRRSLLAQLGAAPPQAAGELLAPYLRADAVDDERTVLSAIEAAGVAREGGLVLPLVELLGLRRYRASAMDALRRSGEIALERLCEALQRDDQREDVAAAIVRVLGASGRFEVAPTLLAVAHQRPLLTAVALRALLRLRVGAANTSGTEQLYSFAKEEQAQLDQMIERELELAYRELLFLGAGSWSTTRQQASTVDLLARALQESVDEHVGRIFRLLALRYDADDLRAAYRGLRSPLKTIRAGSLELLDNVLPAELKERLLPLLDDTDARLFSDVARRAAGLTAETRDALLGRLLTAPDPLARAVAAYVVGREQRSALRSLVAQAALPAYPWLEAELARATHWLEQKDAAATAREEPTVGLTIIERALKLQSVDVLQRASTEDLTYVAQIAREEEHDAGVAIYSEGDAPDALFVVVEGSVRLHRGELEIAVLEAGEAFGSWALVDEAPRVASATTVAQTTLLKVDREDFVELLGDRVDIVQAVFKAMVERLRVLADVAKGV